MAWLPRTRPGCVGDGRLLGAVRGGPARDAADECLDLCALPLHLEIRPEYRELLGPGRTLRLHATDTAPEARAEWVVDLTGEVITWRRAHEKSAVAVRAPLTDLLLLLYRRRQLGDPSVEVVGDEKLLGFFLERVAFGLSPAPERRRSSVSTALRPRCP